MPGKRPRQPALLALGAMLSSAMAQKTAAAYKLSAEMKADGWKLVGPSVGDEACRSYSTLEGATVDVRCVVVAYAPPEGTDAALWRIVHLRDGDQHVWPDCCQQNIRPTATTNAAVFCCQQSAAATLRLSCAQRRCNAAASPAPHAQLQLAQKQSA